MRVPGWRRVIYPLWLAWYRWRLDAAIWKSGPYAAGDSTHWRGVKLVCCTGHFVGDKAEHPWDPGCGWPALKANALWEPARSRDRFLLSLIGDPRRRLNDAPTR